MARKKAPLMLRLSVYLIFLLILIVGGGLWYLNNLRSPVSNDQTTKAFVIEKGEATDKMAQDLQDQGLIRSSLVFKYFLKQTGSDTNIAAGDYKLSPSMSLDQIIQILAQGQTTDKWVTFLEGWRDEEYALKLEKEVGIQSAEFLKYAKEGYMFPDTYLINKDMSAQDVASLLENTFDQKYSPDLRSKVEALGLTDAQGVVLASIVEREGRSDQVRTNIAGILLKRLKIGMALNVDATIQFAKDSQTIKSGQLPDQFWQPVSPADIKNINSPYNTYLYPGLPPGPISNPSLSSLQAVANADPSTPDLYYYVDSQGNIYYATTLDQQNANVANHP